jgi:hypothetical protein
MRTITVLLAVGVLGVAGPARATSMPFTATLRVEIANLQSAVFNGSGTGESVPGGGASIPAGGIVAGLVSRLNQPLLGVLPGFAICGAGLPTAFDPSPASFPIPSAVGGQASSCAPLADGFLDAVLYDDAAGVATGGLLADAYLTNQVDNAVVALPLDVVGVGGVVNFELFGTPYTLAGNPWTIGAVSVTGALLGAPPATLTDVGFDARDATGAGTLKLVTTALGDLGSLGTVPALVSLEIQFAVPEPGTLLLLTCGLVGLGLRRQRV